MATGQVNLNVNGLDGKNLVIFNNVSQCLFSGVILLLDQGMINGLILF